MTETRQPFSRSCLATQEERGGQWGPVLHNDGRGHVWLFFSESHADCIKPHVEGRLPQRYVIGGDIKVARLNLASQRWSPAVTLYSQDLDGNIPKLTANKLLVLSSGEWVLPFWRERSGLVRPPPPQQHPRVVRLNCGEFFSRIRTCTIRLPSDQFTDLRERCGWSACAGVQVGQEHEDVRWRAHLRGQWAVVGGPRRAGALALLAHREHARGGKRERE